jgi:hypothetical protein
MSEDNRDQSITTGQAFFLSAMVVGLAMLAFVIVRWVLTTRVGAVVGVIATLVFLTVLFTKGLDEPVAANSAPSVPSMQRDTAGGATQNRPLIESGNHPAPKDQGNAASVTVRPADGFPTIIRRSGDSVCATVGDSTTCRPLR